MSPAWAQLLVGSNDADDAPTLLKLHDGGVDDVSSLAISVSVDVKKASLLVELHVN